MTRDEHYASPEIQEILQDLNTQWKDMCDKAKDKGSKLRQAADQETLNKALADAQVCSLEGYGVWIKNFWLKLR